MKDLQLIRLSEHRELAGTAAAWFHERWGIPQAAYAQSMAASRGDAPVPEWYLLREGERIAAGAGVIENDFHDRRDLTPNVCAVYVEPAYRGRGAARELLRLVCADQAARGVSTLYLLTDHIGFYERCGWDFLCMAQGDGEPELSRMYVHTAEPGPERTIDGDKG